MKILTQFLIISLIAFTSSKSQVNNKTAPFSKLPKIVFSTLVSYTYSFSDNSDVLNFSSIKDSATNKNIFNSSNYAMQQGVGIISSGKFAVSRSRRIMLTGTLGYNYFYNTRDDGYNRTRWQIITAGPGIEFNLTRNSKQKSFMGVELLYTLMWGAWQTNITYPDGFQSNIYTRFRPASRVGFAISSGIGFEVSKNKEFVVGLRGVWSNVWPKQNDYFRTAYDAYINDSKNSGGIKLNDSKQVVFFQLMTGLNFQLRK